MLLELSLQQLPLRLVVGFAVDVCLVEKLAEKLAGRTRIDSLVVAGFAHLAPPGWLARLPPDLDLLGCVATLRC